jgi:AmiR/NasT family two-component response regulator
MTSTGVRPTSETATTRSQLDSTAATLADYETKIAHLEIALRTNRRIGIAIGIVMSRYSQTEDQAFDSLRMISQHRNRKLRDVADDVIYTGALPG